MEMECPFFRNLPLCERPDYARTRPLPVRRSSYPVHRTPEKSSEPKVVRIPVHFIRSAQVNRDGSAVKIQKVFRGFLVRKSLKKIKDIRVQGDEIEYKLRKSEVVDLLRREEKERLRMNEMLMSLLFRLDSICGVDFGVRVCRKAVIKKVIALQEKLDAIVASNSDEDVEEYNDPDSKIEATVATDHPGTSDRSMYLEDCGNVMEVEGDDGEAGTIDVGVDCEMKVIECCPNSGVEGVRDDKRNEELVQTMMEENKKLMNLMNQMREREEMRTKMLSALTDRVEILEKALACDMLEKKKRFKSASSC